MKKIMMIGSALLVLSSSVFATEARLIALGMKETDNEGLYYVQDGRNIFQNPANINLFTDRLTVEYGDKGKQLSAANTNATLDKDSKPKAQGGFFKKYGDLNYGFYVGNESNTSSLLRVIGSSAASILNGSFSAAGAASSTALQTADNQLDFFIGGENGLKWGANALVATGKKDLNNSKDTSITTRIGVLGSNWDAHLNLSLASKSSSTDSIVALSNVGGGVTDTAVTQEFKGKLGVQAGGSYLLSDSVRVFGYVKYFGWEQSDSFNQFTLLNARYNAATTTTVGAGGQNGTVKGNFSSFYLGVTKEISVNTADKVLATINLKEQDINLNFTNKSEVRHLVVPVTLAYEAVANEWLTLRGSVVQNIFGVRHNKNLNSLNIVARSIAKTTYGDNGRATLANSTEVNAGATLKFGNVSIDGVISSTDSSRSAADTATTSVSETKHGILALDNMLTRVGMTYTF